MENLKNKLANQILYIENQSVIKIFYFLKNFRVTKGPKRYKCEIINVKKPNFMKKVMSILAVALVATFIACGPSAEEKAKAEEAAKMAADSIAKALEASLSSAVSEAAATVDSAAATTETAAATEEKK